MFDRRKQTVWQSQETIFHFFVERVKTQSPEDVLLEFQRLFIHNVNDSKIEVQHALYEILFGNKETEFINTLKRCCYILINNWEASRQHKPIQELVELFADPVINQYTYSKYQRRLRGWLKSFINGKDYQQIQLFGARYERTVHWSQRYTSYLLVHQYVDLDNSAEQREAAKVRSHHLKERFKFDLAMYTAHAQSGTAIAINTPQNTPKNPTCLGDGVLRLIKIILAKRGPFNYTNLAHIFTQQTEGISYREFKKSLLEYIVFGLDNKAFAKLIKERLSPEFASLYENYNSHQLTKALFLRTCNRALEYFTTEDRTNPSQLFLVLLSQGNPLTLVIVLLKLILISKSSRVHLEARIADLIQHYQDYPESACKWTINFMEVLNIAFAIYAENVQYNLIDMKTNSRVEQALVNLENYRVFSQRHESGQLEESEHELELEEAILVNGE